MESSRELAHFSAASAVSLDPEFSRPLTRLATEVPPDGLASMSEGSGCAPSAPLDLPGSPG